MKTKSWLPINQKNYIAKMADILLETGRQIGPAETRALMALIEPPNEDELDAARKANELLLALQQQADLAQLEASVLNVASLQVSLERQDYIVIHDDFDEEVYRLPLHLLAPVSAGSPLTSSSFRARLRRHLTQKHIILKGTELNYE